MMGMCGAIGVGLMGTGGPAVRQEEPDWSLLLPEDDGKAEVAISCSNCHGLKQVIAQRKTAAGWRATVQKMISSYQVPIDKEDFPLVVGYLAKHCGEGNAIEKAPIDINASTAAALERLPGMTDEMARAIVEYRGRNGRFGSVDELLSVGGVDSGLLKKIKPFISAGD